MHGKQQHKRTWPLRWIILSLIFLTCTLAATQAGAIGAHGGYEFRHGTVAAKGIVLSENGYPIWAAYDTQGEKVEEIGEASGNLADAQAMSREAYVNLMLSLDRPVQYNLDSPSSSIRSVLVSADLQVLHHTANNIGYWTEFFTEEDGEKTWWGPVHGAKVTAFTGRIPTYSDESGTYVVPYFIPPCPCFSFNYDHWVHAELLYLQFNPKSPLFGSYYVSRPAYDHCSGYSACPIGWTLAGVMTKVALIGIEASVANLAHRKVDIPVDVGMLSGIAILRNEPRYGLGIDMNPDVIGNIPKGQTGYTYVPPAVASTALEDYEPDFFDRGLLQSISEEDLKNTDIYVYRVSNDQLITSRQGLTDRELDDNVLNYRFPFRGAADRLNTSSGSLEDFQAATNLSSELRGFKADHLRIGEKIKVIMINRATGYIGTSIGIYGATTNVGLISFTPDPVIMRPPNLKIKAERVWEPQTGMTAGEQIENIIGFEGAGLSSDHYIRVSTEWYDWNGMPLPDDLPGYTGRLAKIVNDKQLAAVSSQVANFGIQPGRQTELVHLPNSDIDDAHFYIHVNGEPPSGNPNFSEIGAAASGPLSYRPKHYVPIQVPIFDEVETQQKAYEQIGELSAQWQPGSALPVVEDLEKVYRWIYRPEMQFSLFELEFEDVELFTDIDSAGSKTSTFSFTYDLFQDPDYDPLDLLGGERQLVFGLGYAEQLAALGEGQQTHFDSVEGLMAITPFMQYRQVGAAINNLQPEDFLGLQLYQNSDAGNQLTEIYGMPLMATNARPMRLMRQYYSGQFDNSIPGGIGAGYTDDYRQVKIELFDSANVTVNLLDADGQHRGELIGNTVLPPGPSVFLVDYEDLMDAGFNTVDHRTFKVEVLAKAVDGSRSQRIHIPGTLNERSEGRMLGQVMVHDVLIHDGSLNLSRSDLKLNGRGPDLEFTRSYNNQPSGRGPKPLGPGWRHNYQIQLSAWTSEAHGNQPIPDWVDSLKGKFFKPSQIPEPDEEWSGASVNGTLFKKFNGTWYAERGRHGTLAQVGSEFVYTAKDGTNYYYAVPKRTETVHESQAPNTSMHVADGMVTRIGVSPAALLLPNDQPPVEYTTTEMPGPSPVKRIVDRNGNTKTFTYGALERLEKVTDAVGRELNFNYQIFGVSGDRLTSVDGPDGISVSFAYNDQHLLESVTRATRKETYTYEYESPGVLGADYNLTAVTDSNDNTTTYDYHDPGELGGILTGIVKAVRDYEVVKEVIYPDTNSANFAYDTSSGNQRTVTDLRGNDTTYHLNTHGNPQRIVEPMGKDTFMTWSIDEGQNDNVMLTKSDPRNSSWIWEYSHDAKGNIETETDPYGNTISTTWDQTFSVPTYRRDRNGVEKSWDYDANGNLMTFTDGDGKDHTYTYYATGERRTATDPRINTTNYTYDIYGNPDRETGDEGSVTNYEYDVRGRKRAHTDPNGNTTRWEPNTLDQITEVYYESMVSYSLPAAYSRHEEFTYDAEGNMLTKTDRMGQTLTYEYTVRDQVDFITRSFGGGTKDFDYDANGNLTHESDWQGIDTVHTYDALNRRDGTTNRLGHSMSMGYDENGNLTSSTDYEGNPSSYEYDRLNRQTEIHMPDLEGQSVVITKTYYDEADPQTNLHTETDPEGNTTTYAYNGRYQRTSRTNALNDTYVWAYDDAGNLESETDEENTTTTYSYDRQNRRIDTHRAGVHVAHNAYDAAGNVRFFTDANGHTSETRYDQWNRAYLTIDAEGHQTLTHLDGGGNKVYERDGNNHTRTWTYDRRGLMTAHMDAENNTTGYAYDANGNLETVTYANSAVTRSTYDSEDRERTVTEAQGLAEARSREIVSRDRNGNPTLETDFNGNSTGYAYNELNLVKTITDAAANTTEKTYYRTGKLRAETDRRGHSTTYAYDDLNRVERVTDALNQSIVTTYDNVGNVKTVTDKRGIVTENFYDDFYRLERTEKAGVRIVTNEYDDAGNLTAVIDAENNRTEHDYYDNNWKRTTTFADTTTNSFTYDGVGKPLTAIDELNKVTAYTYDNENRQRTITFAGETTEFVYDEMGNKTDEIKPEGNRRSFEYDKLNRLARVIDDPDGLALATRFEYDDNGNQRHQYDARNNHVEYTYDALNRRTAHIQHKSGGNLTVSYDLYDEEGNLKQTTDAMGRVFTFDYDELNRQTHRYSPDIDSPFNQTTVVVTGYDENNNVTSITETKIREDDTSFTEVTVNNYDDFDRLDDTTQRGLLTDYGYDDNGNRTNVTTPAGTTTYTYDVRNRLETAVADGETTVYTYYDDGRKESVTYPNGTVADYTYTAANRIDTVVNSRTADSSVISSYDYDYDANGNRTEQIEVQNGVTETTTYVYDDLDRLTDYTVAGADTEVTGYTYEGYNRKTETVTLNGTVTKDRTFTYDQTDWLTLIEDTTTPASPYTIAYTYDNNGNTLTKSNSSLTNQNERFAYDALNRLVETKRGPPAGETVTGRYDYNAAGLRIRHRLSSRGDVDYFYDDNAVIEEHDASDDSLLAHYRYADRLISLDTGTAKQYYHHDALGSTVNLTTPAAAVQVSYKLDPWGHIRDQIGTSVNRQIFTGQEHDENTGLIYFGARYYDPDTARFINQDTYLGQPGTPPSLHRYLYAYSNPTIYIDLTGNAPILSGVSDFLHGLVNDSKASINTMNKEIQRGDVGFFGDLGRRTSAAFMGIGNVIIGTAATVVDAADFAADAQIAVTGIGTEKMVSDARDKMVRAGETALNIADAGAQLVVKTIEDPSGTAKELVTTAVEGTGNYLKKTFIEGDLNYTADFSGKMFELAATAATAGTASSGSLANMPVSQAMKQLGSRSKGALGKLRRFIRNRGATRKLDAMADNLKPVPCFAAGTLVMTAEGLRPIEEVQEGDRVLSRDELSGEIDYRPVARTFITPDKPTLDLSFEDEAGNGENFQVTDEHPFWVKARGWVGAGDLLPDDEVFTSSGGWLKVTGSTWVSERQVVYNLEVEGFHTYFVGQRGVWVHNQCHIPVDPKKTVSRHSGPRRFKKNNPQFDDGTYEIHHSREWNVLDRYPGTFSPEDLNLGKFMRPIKKGQMFRGKSLHRSTIRKTWDNFQDLFQDRFSSGDISQDKMRQLINKHADYVDRMYLGE